MRGDAMGPASVGSSFGSTFVGELGVFTFTWMMVPAENRYARTF